MIISEHPPTMWGCVGAREQRREGLWGLLVPMLLVAGCVEVAPAVGEANH